MELKSVKLVSKLAPQEGVGQQSGKEWMKQTFVFEETDTKYPKNIALTAWNSTAKELNLLATNSVVDCEVKLESREYQGKWYTDAILANFRVLSTTVKAAAVTAQPSPDDDLPF